MKQQVAFEMIEGLCMRCGEPGPHLVEGECITAMREHLMALDMKAEKGRERQRCKRTRRGRRRTK